MTVQSDQEVLFNLDYVWFDPILRGQYIPILSKAAGGRTTIAHIFAALASKAGKQIVVYDQEHIGKEIKNSLMRAVKFHSNSQEDYDRKFDDAVGNIKFVSSLRGSVNLEILTAPEYEADLYIIPETRSLDTLRKQSEDNLALRVFNILTDRGATVITPIQVKENSAMDELYSAKELYVLSLEYSQYLPKKPDRYYFASRNGGSLFVQEYRLGNGFGHSSSPLQQIDLAAYNSEKPWEFKTTE